MSSTTNLETSRGLKNVKVKYATWERLREFGDMGDTMDAVINRLINAAESIRRGVLVGEHEFRR